MNKKLGLTVSILGIVSVMLITIGITYAFFNYAKTGESENVISSGTITFIYEEIDKQGAGILIENAYPMSDSDGKLMSNAKEVFNFKIKSTTSSSFKIPYTVTARKNSNSTLSNDAVRIYLTEVTDVGETEVLLDNYNELPVYSNVGNQIDERIIYEGVVPINSSNYEKNFRLRMWIDSDTKFSPDQDDNYQMNDKTFKINVNVYSNAKVVTNDTTNNVTYKSYNIGDSVTGIDGSKWHVLEASGSDNEYVTLLGDYNLNRDGSYNDQCGRDIDGDYECSTIAYDLNGDLPYDINDENNIGYFINNTYMPLVTQSLPGTINVTIPTAQQIALADFKEVELYKPLNLSTNSWITTTMYWTSTGYVGNGINGPTTYVYVVYGNTSALAVSEYAKQDYRYGVRPVITTLKSNLLSASKNKLRKD